MQAISGQYGCVYSGICHCSTARRARRRWRWGIDFGDSTVGLLYYRELLLVLRTDNQSKTLARKTSYKDSGWTSGPSNSVLRIEEANRSMSSRHGRPRTSQNLRGPRNPSQDGIPPCLTAAVWIAAWRSASALSSVSRVVGSSAAADPRGEMYSKWTNTPPSLIRLSYLGSISKTLNPWASVLSRTVLTRWIIDSLRRFAK
jgi:hypothetical protein